MFVAPTSTPPHRPRISRRPHSSRRPAPLPRSQPRRSRRAVRRAQRALPPAAERLVLRRAARGLAVSRYGDRGCDQFSESLQPFFGVARQEILEDTTIAPQSPPSAKMGLPTIQRKRCRRTAAPSSPVREGESRSSTRAGRPVRRTSAEIIPSKSPIVTRPGCRCSRHRHTRPRVALNLRTPAAESKRRATSSLTAEKISVDGRRSQPAWRRAAGPLVPPASAARASRDCAFAIAVANSALKSARRLSVPAASEISSDAIVIAPHNSPSTRTGVASAERTPDSRATVGGSPSHFCRSKLAG